jgi:hypothetical protein
MKRTRIKMAAGLAVLILAYLFCVRPRAQAPDKSENTNWMGYLVVGKKESFDPIAGRKPYPEASTRVQIGLRADGVVVWRNALNAK